VVRGEGWDVYTFDWLKCGVSGVSVVSEVLWRLRPFISAMYAGAVLRGMEYSSSCTSKILGDKNRLHNAITPQLQIKIRLWRLQEELARVSCLPSLFVVLRGLEVAERGYFRFYTEAYFPASLTRKSLGRQSGLLTPFYSYRLDYCPSFPCYPFPLTPIRSISPAETSTCQANAVIVRPRGRWSYHQMNGWLDDTHAR
jgi:hypothetical protein